MELGIHINTFRRSTLADTLDAVVDHDLRCVHFNLAAAGVPSMPERVDEELPGQIAEALSSRDITIGTFSGTFNMIHPSVDVRRAGLRRLDTVAKVAAATGAKVVAVCTGTRDRDDMWHSHPDNDTPQAWSDLLAMMGEAIEIAEQNGVILGIEPELANVVDSAAKARRLLDEVSSPQLKIILDPANLFRSGDLSRMAQVLEGAFDLLGDDLVAAHAKDLDRDGQAGQIPAGQGLLDFDLYLRLLQQADFDGPLILHSLAEADVPGCVQFLRKKLTTPDE